ncbi:hypothetical protein BJ742DRAFT_828472 [Cladochytrium replicatum]|nr:hypothetical protein BJ742DRAFT_828472 [Cladochytrium replicatum]
MTATTVYHWTFDHPAHFKLAVRLDKISERPLPLNAAISASLSTELIDEVVINWQHKILSPIEEAIKNGGAIILEDWSRPRIFTYIASDGYDLDSALCEEGGTDPWIAHTAPQAEKALLKLSVPKVNQSRIATRSSKQTETMAIMVYIPLDETTTRVANKAKRTAGSQQMDSIAPRNYVERSLCRICISNEGLVSIAPALGTHHFNVGKSSYSFTITNTSAVPSDESEKFEYELYKAIYSSRRYAFTLPPSLEPSAPSPPGMWIHVHFELVSAAISDPFSSNLHSTFQFRADGPVKLVDPEISQITTQSCFGAFDSDHGCTVSHFGYLSELILEMGFKADVPNPPPRFEICVRSSTPPNIVNVEGYGTLAIVLDPGVYDRSVPLWRPVHMPGLKRAQSDLRAFFIGGAPELEHLDGVSSTGANGSRFGWKTESTGWVRIRYQVATRIW